MKPLYSINETPFINGPTVTGDEFSDLLGFWEGRGNTSVLFRNGTETEACKCYTPCIAVWLGLGLDSMEYSLKKLNQVLFALAQIYSEGTTMPTWMKTIITGMESFA